MISIRPARLPTTVLTGFLGAGKTTLLRTLLADPAGERIGVLVNDFGEINIDAALIVESTAGSVSLSNGCVCCTIQTELVEAIRTLVASRPDLDRLVIEASGVSRSVALADTLVSEELSDVISLDAMLCLVDAAAFGELDYAATELAIDQITGADLLVLNKVDLVSPDEQAQLCARLAGLMPTLRIVPARHGAVPREILFADVRSERSAQDDGQDEPACDGHHVHGWQCGCDHSHEHSSHTAAFLSWSWRTDEPLDENRVRTALRKAAGGLLRAKGLLRVRTTGGGEACYEYQQVGKRSRLTRIERHPPHESALVVIGMRNRVDAPAIGRALDACRLPAEPTQPREPETAQGPNG